MVITKTQLSRELGLSKGRVSQLLRRGLPVRQDGSIDRDLAIVWYRSNVVPHAREGSRVARPQSAVESAGEPGQVAAMPPARGSGSLPGRDAGAESYAVGRLRDRADLVVYFCSVFELPAAVIRQAPWLLRQLVDAVFDSPALGGGCPVACDRVELDLQTLSGGWRARVAGAAPIWIKRHSILRENHPWLGFDPLPLLSGDERAVRLVIERFRGGAWVLAPTVLDLAGERAIPAVLAMPDIIDSWIDEVFSDELMDRLFGNGKVCAWNVDRDGIAMACGVPSLSRWEGEADVCLDRGVEALRTFTESRYRGGKTF